MSHRQASFSTVSNARMPALLVLAVVLGSSCSHERSVTSESVGAAYEALAGKMKDCERAKHECKDAANCDPAKLAVCENDFQTCRDAARAEEQALHAATHACRVAEETCEDNAVDEAARKLCHEQHHACMEATEPPEPPCHAELEVCLDAAHAANPPPPPPPPPPAPPRMHPPETAAEAACHDRARACMLAEMGDKPGAGDAGSRAHPHCEPPGGAAGHAEPPHPPSPAGIGGAAGH